MTSIASGRSSRRWGRRPLPLAGREEAKRRKGSGRADRPRSPRPSPARGEGRTQPPPTRSPARANSFPAAAAGARRAGRASPSAGRPAAPARARPTAPRPGCPARRPDARSSRRSAQKHRSRTRGRAPPPCRPASVQMLRLAAGDGGGDRGHGDAAVDAIAGQRQSPRAKMALLQLRGPAPGSAVRAPAQPLRDASPAPPA